MLKVRTLETDAQTAATYRVSIRTARRWRTAKAPVADPARMGEWLAGQQRVPPGTEAALAKTAAKGRRPQAKAPTAPAPGETGAPAAKDRLDRAEREAAERHRLAVTSGNPVAVKVTLAQWAKLLAEVREYHRAIPAAERVGGDVIPRGEAQATLASFVHWSTVALRQAMQAAVSRVAGRPPAEAVNVVGASVAAYVSAVAGIVQSKDWSGGPPMPEWGASAIAKGLDWPYGSRAGEVIEGYKAAFEQFTVAAVEVAADRGLAKEETRRAEYQSQLADLAKKP